MITHKYHVSYAWFVYLTIGILWILTSLGIWHVFNRHGGRMKYWVFNIVFSFPTYFLLSSHLTLLERSYAIFGLLLYAIGAIIFSRKACNFFPHIFGYHEVFHIFTILAALQGYHLFASLSIEDLTVRCMIMQNVREDQMTWRMGMWLLSQTLSTSSDICT